MTPHKSIDPGSFTRGWRATSIFTKLVPPWSKAYPKPQLKILCRGSIESVTALFLPGFALPVLSARAASS